MLHQEGTDHRETTVAILSRAVGQGLVDCDLLARRPKPHSNPTARSDRNRVPAIQRVGELAESLSIVLVVRSLGRTER